ncbi:hypothetical protein [Baaleninema simplex]
MLATKKFSIEDYHRLIELGFFKEGDRIELIRGELGSSEFVVINV